jgi:hypothetical protein
VEAFLELLQRVLLLLDCVAQLVQDGVSVSLGLILVDLSSS